MALLAEALGTPLMPWQRQVVDVALEYVPDPESRRGWSWCYRTVVVTVQRQSGKTTLVGPVHLHRTLQSAYPTYLTAQKRSDARDTWLDVVRRLGKLTETDHPLASAFLPPRLSNGDEGVWSRVGGAFRVFAPTEDALHGKPCTLVTIDEGWAFDEAQGAALLQAAKPTFSTTGGQLWLPSTAGHGGSTWLRGYVDRGRAAVEADRRTGLAYFEHSLDADTAAAVTAGLDQDDPVVREAAVQLVLAQHPGAGRTLDVGALRDAADDMTPDAFLRAYGNVWTASADVVLPAHVWDACRFDGAWQLPEPGHVALAFDVALDRSCAAIGAAWRETATGPLHVEVLDSHAGDSWLAPRLRELCRTWRPGELVHSGGPNLDVADELARGGLNVRQLSFPEYATGCATFLSSARNRRLAHNARPALDTAVAAAAVKQLGDAWCWSRRSSSASIAPLVAVTAASWAFDHKAAPAARPVVMVRRRAA